jgi:diamine N-acetyltransferase
MSEVRFDSADVRLVPVGVHNWRLVADLEVNPEQASFVAPVTRYLALCAFDRGPWQPLAVTVSGEAVGFVMRGIDPDERSLWIGGLLIANDRQGRGYGSATVQILIDEARAGKWDSVALSYEPENRRARELYARMGFRETGDAMDDEIVARLVFS